MNKVVVSHSLNPYENLALEELLFDEVSGVTLYLWQNDKTVVIGRNQNAYAECSLTAMKRDGIYLARRKSGGGAVYHGIGNLNFTFIAEKPLYDLNKQLNLVLDAVRAFGIDGELSGRNDLCVNGKKFSGNAFRHSATASLHHGTLLINENKSALSSYLNPSKRKLEAKGVASVSARVTNLADYSPTLTVDEIKKSITEKFYESYGEYESFTEKNFSLASTAEAYASEAWLLGKEPPFSISLSKRFSCGETTFLFDVKNGIVNGIKIYSDSLDETLPKALEGALLSVPFSTDGIRSARNYLPQKPYAEIFSYLEERLF